MTLARPATRTTQSSRPEVIGRATLPRPARMALMAAAMISLVLALWAGLLRAGWGWPPVIATLPAGHGPLMVCGFLGTMIGLERAVGLGKRWAFAAPVFTAVGAGAVVFGAPPFVAALLMSLGSLLLAVILAQLLRIQVALYLVALVVGAVTWLGGNLVWLFGWPIPVAALFWLAFLVITISGERLELSRMLKLSQLSQWLFAFALAALVVAPLVGVVDYGLGTTWMGVALLAMAAWLLRYDIAWRRLKAGGQARYTAYCLLAGYVWLVVGGLIALTRGGLMAGPAYDAMLHCVFVGFVFSMVFGHAPIIFPAVLQLPVRYRPAFYVPLVLLHVSLVLRVFGDLAGDPAARRWGSLLGALVIVLFLGLLISSAQLRSNQATASP